MWVILTAARFITLRGRLLGGMPGVRGYSSNVFSGHVFERVEDLKPITATK